MVCAGSAEKMQKNKPLTLKEKMAQALINRKTFTPSRTTTKVIASKPTISASSLSGIPAPGTTSTADSSGRSDTSHAAAAAAAPDWSDMPSVATTLTASTATDQQKKKKKNNKKKNKKKNK
jgi:ParB-like chromosome segregation protein Spo0J